MIGKQLRGRYELLVKIGEGGMANVYSARDNLLNRTVTVKILKDYLVSDQDFVRRFRREAQAAAALSHPHIINIHDVGEEGDIHYIVMEYVQGKTLKDLIREKQRLPADEAMEIFRQITEAILHAHSNKVIHRDIKPQNILISRSGQIKVTDFGIALAVNAATVTYNEQVMGSVHYFSPEQAKGNFTGEQSDIYSLGIVLYEMLTGQVPYMGDSPISVALKHLNEQITPPRTLFGDIPEPLERMVLKAVQKNPSQRYTNTRELLEDIRLWQRERKTNAAVLYDDEHEIENTRILKPLHEKQRNDYEAKKEKTRKPFWKNKVALVAMGMFLLLAMLFGGYYLVKNLLAVPDVEVPEVEGLVLEKAEEKLDEAGLNYSKTFKHHETVEEDHVISQDPAAGSKVKKSREVVLEISKGREIIKVPEVTNIPQREASLILKQHKLEFQIEEEFNSKVEAGYVIRQDPRPGVQLYQGDEVILYISKGERSFPIRNLVGEREVDVKVYLNQEGLIINKEKSEFSDKPPGTVIEQYPPAGTDVKPGDLVDIIWSKGPDPSTVNVEGPPEDDEYTEVGEPY
ncbi:MAG: Stk1 family PASTA domain-containing Ser/Thr kinase [Dethiobacteria bacterium]